jgi:hypothetical protein
METPFDSATAADVSREDLVSVMTSLEPDQLSCTKARHHCPLRKLSGTEMVLFWALRFYLVFMFGIVIYQVWTGAR